MAKTVVVKVLFIDLYTPFLKLH